MVPLMQDFVDLERLPFNRDYKGILGNIMAIRKMKRPRYKTRLNPDIGGSAQKYSMVPGRSSADSRGFLWTSEVDPLEQHHLSLALVADCRRQRKGVLCHVCTEHAQPAIWGLLAAMRDLTVSLKVEAAPCLVWRRLSLVLCIP